MPCPYCQNKTAQSIKLIETTYTVDEKGAPIQKIREEIHMNITKCASCGHLYPNPNGVLK